MVQDLVLVWLRSPSNIGFFDSTSSIGFQPFASKLQALTAVIFTYVSRKLIRQKRISKMERRILRLNPIQCNLKTRALPFGRDRNLSVKLLSNAARREKREAISVLFCPNIHSPTPLPTGMESFLWARALCAGGTPKKGMRPNKYRFTLKQNFSRGGNHEPPNSTAIFHSSPPVMPGSKLSAIPRPHW